MPADGDEAAELEVEGPSRVSSRRRFLARAGVGVALVGLGAAGAEAIRAATVSEPRPRAVVAPSSAVRIDGVTVVDPADGSRVAGRSILVDGGRVRAVTATADAPSSGARVIDGTGRFAVPGYNEMHTHVLQLPDTELGLTLMLAQGITGMRQMEGSPELLADRAQQRLGLDEYAPQLLGMPGDLLLPFNAASVEGVREEIARQWDQGADFIKMILTEPEVFFAAVDEAHRRGLRIAGHLPPAVHIEDAAAAGFDSIEHLGTGQSVFLTLSSESQALWAQEPTGLPFPAWVARLPFAAEFFDAFLKESFLGPATSTTDEAQIALLRRAFETYSEERTDALGRSFADNGVWHCPTLVGLRGKYRPDGPEFREDPWLQRAPADQRERQQAGAEAFRAAPQADRDVLHEYYERCVRTVGRIAAAGTRIMSGTDTSGRGVARSIHEEFRELGRAGLSPLEVLRSTTTAPAEYLGRGDRMGRIVPGADADLLLLAADPLQSVENLATVCTVVRAGHVHPIDALDARVGALLATA